MKLAIAIIAPWVAMYAVGSFITLEANFANWTEHGRTIYVFFSAMLLTMSVTFYTTNR